MQTIEINSVADLIRAKDIMIETQEDVNITQVSELEYTIKLQGGRYDNYNFEYIDADIAKIILEYQEQYNHFVTALEERFNIQIPQSQKMLKFKLETGCLEVSVDLTNIALEGIRNMEGWQTMTVFIVAIVGWFARSSYHKYIEKEIKQIELRKDELDIEKERIRNEREIKDKELEKEKLDSILNNIKELVSDRNLQAPANYSKKVIASTLLENEKALINPEILEQSSDPITTEDKEKFRVVLPQEEDLPNIEEEIDEIFHVEAQHFSANKPFKLKELRFNVNSDVISTDKRMHIIRKAERREPVRLKIKLIKNPNTQAIEQAYILDVLN